MINRHIEPVWLAQSFLDDLVLIYPVYALMMLEGGVGEFELSILFMIWSVTAFVLEIPSGVIADRVDRRWYLFIGCIAGAGGFLCWLVWPSFWGFALGFVLWSVGSAIHSGTQQSLLHDVLTEQDRAGDFARIYGRGKSAQSLAVLCAMGLGGFVAEHGYNAVLLLSALAPLLSGTLVVGLLREPPRTFVAESDETRPLSVALAALKGSRTLMLITMMFILFMGLSGVVDEYLGPLLVEQGDFSLGLVGVLYGVMLGSRAGGTALAHRLRAWPLRRIGLTSALAHGLLLLGLASGFLVHGVIMVLLLSLYFAAMGAIEVLLEANLQSEIDVGARATITSVAGAGLEVWATGLFLYIGLVASQSGWSAALSSVGMVAIVVSMCLAWLAGGIGFRRWPGA